MAFLRLMRGFLKSLLQLVQFLAQVGKRLFCWIGFLTCLLGGTEIGFCHSIILVPATVLGSMRSMRAPMFLAEFAGLLETDFLGNLLCGSSTGPLGSCLVLVRSFLAGLRMSSPGYTCTQYPQEKLEENACIRSRKQGDTREALHFFVEFMICVRLLCQTLLFSKVWHSLLVAKGPTKFGTVRQTAKEYRSTKYLS
jgi:hypothetical protein